MALNNKLMMTLIINYLKIVLMIALYKILIKCLILGNKSHNKNWLGINIKMKKTVGRLRLEMIIFIIIMKVGIIQISH